MEKQQPGVYLMMDKTPRIRFEGVEPMGIEISKACLVTIHFHQLNYAMLFLLDMK